MSRYPVVLLIVLFLCGCVERRLTVRSDPPGALIYLNDEEVGRTPMTRDFLWYGTYDVQLRKEGYQTIDKPTRVWAPWWQIPPIDLLAELLPFPVEDRHSLDYAMKPVSSEQEDPEQLIDRAQNMRGRLQSSEYRKKSP